MEVRYDGLDGRLEGWAGSTVMGTDQRSVSTTTAAGAHVITSCSRPRMDGMSLLGYALPLCPTMNSSASCHVTSTVRRTQ